MSPPMGTLVAKAPFNIKWIILGREVSKTVINQQVKRDIKLKVALKKFYMRLTFKTQFTI